MSWFPTTSTAKQPTPSTPEPSQDGGYIAPDRTGRQRCWEGRDSFFQCLASNGIIDSVKEDAKARKLCAPELGEFERVCASSWVSCLWSYKRGSGAVVQSSPVYSWGERAKVVEMEANEGVFR